MMLTTIDKRTYVISDTYHAIQEGDPIVRLEDKWGKEDLGASGLVYDCIQFEADKIYRCKSRYSTSVECIVVGNLGHAIEGWHKVIRLATDEDLRRLK